MHTIYTAAPPEYGKQDFFKIKAMPELSSKGTLRATRVPLKDFKILNAEPVIVQFALPSGSYVYIWLR